MKKKTLLLFLLLSILDGGEYPKDSSVTKINNIINHAKKYIHKVKYKWGGTSLSNGIDCSAFVREMYKPYVHLPRTTNQQIHYSKKIEVPRVDWIKKGDLIYFKFEDEQRYKKVDHVGIYIGNNKFIHSSSSLKGVQISTLSRKWKRNIMRIIRIKI